MRQDPICRTRAHLSSLAVTCLLLTHFGCGSGVFDPCGGSACMPSAQDCAALPDQDWAVEGYNLFPESQVTGGTTVKTYLAPDVEDHCSGAVTRIVWSVADEAVASVLPAGASAWVTGLEAGAAEVRALVVFASGGQRQAHPRLYRVPGTVENWRGWVTFTTRSAGRLDVVVDWESVLNSIDFSGYEGRCTTVGTCGRIVLSVRHMNVKPLTEIFANPRMPAREYTIRIDNLGPGEETIRYEVRLTPS